MNFSGSLKFFLFLAWLAFAEAQMGDVDLEKASVRSSLRKRLAQLKPEERFDFAFIDADKVSYDKYFELLLPHMRQNGLLLFDNMLMGGKLLALEPADENVRALDALNKKLASDPRVESVLLAVANGLTICRKRVLD